MNRFLLIIILLFSVGATVFAQVSIELTGVVKANDKGTVTELVGANVYWANTQSGTVSDFNGQFKIEQKAGNTKLVISYIGYKADTLLITNNSFLDVVLESDQLDEVLVAGKKAGSHMSRIDPLTKVNITGAELCKAACCNLSESFETNASVDVSYADAATGAKQIQLLGLSGNYVQMMTENIPNFRGLATLYGLNYIPGAWMESIQISKGTATVINGYEALTGQINVEYKKPVNSEKFFLNVYANNTGRWESNVNGSIHINDKWTTAILAHYSEDQKSTDDNDDGFRDEPLLKQLNFINRWDYNNKNGFTSQIGIKVLDENRLGGQMGFEGSQPRDQNIGTPEQLYGINIDTRRYEGFYKAGYVFDDEVSSLALVANYAFHEQNSFYGRKQYDAQQRSLYANLIFQSVIGNDNNKFSTGVSFQSDEFDEVLIVDFQQPDNKQELNRQEVVPGAYFQYTYSLPERLTVIAGGRVDFHNNFGTLFTPRIHAKYNIAPNTILRASAGKGYRTPNVLAENSYLLASSRDINIANDLDQEEAWNYGANITQYINIAGKELTLNAEYYRTDFQNQLIVDADQSVNAVYFYNLNGKSYANNFQLEGKYELLRGMDVVAAWRLNDVKATYDGELLDRPLISRTKGLVNLSYSTPLKKWQFDFTTQFNGKGRVPSTEANPVEYQRPSSFDAYQIVNSQITRYFRKWNVYVGVENLGDFKQDEPIIAGDDPFGDEFDSSLIWGPIMGRRVYFGLRFSIDRE
ncbi:TonB-dependent siderophore receptor [Carboxylicivirga sp. M1479]|uniref:TonB-dependent receptor plug domain-containing protein n=1 Tax=Carboxylicivirga sp. M1479 TaxID=2594476 RepID=UPI00117808BD|nr:TonB-dependent receptor [Carboxylicivirga sp. M1479]TRX71092.1 TonB-dependent receptor [Carboxylicivirga sp. M1479]